MTRYPVYAPDFQIQINGDPMPAAVRSVVTSVRYQDGRNASDRVEVDIANPDLRWLQEHIRGLGFQPFPTAVKIGPVQAVNFAEGTFDIDNKLELSMGYAPDPLEYMFKGEVTGIQVSFPNGGMPSLTLVAHDYLQRLAEGTYAGGFGFLPDYLVAMILSARNLLIPLIDPTVGGLSAAKAIIDIVFKGTGMKQGAACQGESDLAFIKRLADRYDADFWVDGDILYISRFIKEYSPRLTLTWGESLIDFTPQMSTVGQVAGVSMKFTLRELRLTFLVTVFWDFDSESLGTSIVPGVASKGPPVGGGPNFTRVDQSISSPGDIVASALVIIRRLREKLNKRLTGSGTAIGNPQIRAGAMIRIEGLGPDFSGNYRVSSATHSIDSGGYKTQFSVFKEIIP